MRRLVAFALLFGLVAPLAAQQVTPSATLQSVPSGGTTVVESATVCSATTGVCVDEDEEEEVADSSLLTGLVSYWALDEASGTRADSHGSNDLTDNNTVGSASKGVGAPANLPDTVASFVVPNDEYLSNATGAASLDPTLGITIAVWMKSVSVNAAIPFSIGTSIAGGGSGFYALYRQSSHHANVYSDNVAQGVYETIIDLLDETWYLAIHEYDPATKKWSISINGGALQVPPSGMTNHPDFSSGDNRRLWFGLHWGGSVYWDGLIGPSAMWNRQLTADERACLYAAGSGVAYPFTGVCVS